MRLPAGRSSTSTPASSSLPSSSSTRLDETQAALAAGEQRRRHLLEVARDGLERLVEAPLHGLGELVAKLRDLRQRRLEILPLRRELLEPLLLLLVLLLGQRIHLAERLAAGIEPLRPRRELGAVVALGGLVGACLVEAALRLLRLGVETRELDLDCGCPLRCLVGPLPHLDLGGTEPSQLLPEPGGAFCTRIDASADGCFEPGGELPGAVEPGTQDSDGVEQAGQHVGIERRAPRCALEQRRVGVARAIGGGARLDRSSLGERQQRRRFLDELLARRRFPGREIVEAAAEPGDDDLGRLCACDGVRSLAGCIGLERREATELCSELPGLLGADREPRGKGLLEPLRGRAGTLERGGKGRGDLDEGTEHDGIDGALAEVGDGRERCLGSCRRLGCLGRGMGCRSGAARQLLGLVGQGAPARVHLEQDGLGRLAREPELAALGVVAVALGRDHGAVPRVEQPLGGDEPEPVEQA